MRGLGAAPIPKQLKKEREVEVMREVESKELRAERVLGMLAAALDAASDEEMDDLELLAQHLLERRADA
jgi:hypothetical protein